MKRPGFGSVRFGIPVAVLVAVAVSVSGRDGEPAQGTWEGIWRQQGDTLRVRVELEHESTGWRGSFASEDLGVLDILFRNVVVTGREVACDAVGDFTTTHFTGLVHGDSLCGSMAELPNRHGAGDVPIPGSFELRRAQGFGRPYDILPAAFQNGAVRLAGSILVPRDGGRHPAVILVAGSLAEPRGSMMFIADHLARRGIVALVYDKRGSGESTGDWKDCTNEDLGRDAAAGVDLLASLPSVDRNRVGLYGHSQGAMLAPFVAVKDPAVRYLISAGGFGGYQYEQDLARVGGRIAQSGFSAGERTEAMGVYRRFLQVARSADPGRRAAFLDSIKVCAGRGWFTWLALPDESSYWWTLYPKTAGFSPMPYWPRVNVPILLLHGERDDTCPMHPGLDRETEVLHASGAGRVTVKIFPGADHSFRLVQKPGQVWPHLSPDFLDFLTNWILAQ